MSEYDYNLKYNGNCLHIYKKMRIVLLLCLMCTSSLSVENSMEITNDVCISDLTNYQNSQWCNDIIINDYFNCKNMEIQTMTQNYTNLKLLYNPDYKNHMCDIEDLNGNNVNVDDIPNFELSYETFFNSKKTDRYYTLLKKEFYSIILYVSRTGSFIQEVLDLQRELQLMKLESSAEVFVIVLTPHFTFTDRFYTEKLFKEMVNAGQILGILTTAETNKKLFQNLFIENVSETPVKVSVTESSSNSFRVHVGNTTRKYLYNKSVPTDCGFKLCYLNCEKAMEQKSICIKQLDKYITGSRVYRHFLLTQRQISYIDNRILFNDNDYDIYEKVRYKRDTEESVEANESTTERETISTSEATTDESIGTSEATTVRETGSVSNNDVIMEWYESSAMPFIRNTTYPVWFQEWLQFEYNTQSLSNDDYQQFPFNNIVDISNPYKIELLSDRTNSINVGKLELKFNNQTISLSNIYKCYHGIVPAESPITKCSRINIQLIQ